MRKINSIKLWFILVTLFLSVFAIGQVETRSDKKKEGNAEDPSLRMQMQIEKINQKFAQATINQDIEAMMGFYTNDVISMPNYGKMIKGKPALTKSQEEMIKSGAKVTAMNLKTLEVLKMGSEFIEIGTYKITFHSPKMQMPVTDEGKYLTIWEKKGKGDLRIKVEIWNTDINPMTFMEKMSKEKKTLEGAKPATPNEEKP